MFIRGFVFFLLIGSVSIVCADPVASDSKSNNEQLVKAEKLFREGKIDDAFKELQDATKKNPSLAPARLILARMFLAANQPGVARGLLELAVTENPEHPEVYLTNASLALAESRITDTILNCRTALELTNAERWTQEQKKVFNREARAGLTTAFENRGDWTSARSQLIAWLELEPKNGVVRQRLGRTLFRLGKTDDAFAELLSAIKDEPTLEPPEVSMGFLYASINDSKKAMEWFDKAVQKYNSNPRVHQSYGAWLLDSHKLEAARLHIEAAAKLDPKSPQTLRLQGILARYEKNYTEAEKIFEQLQRENPADFVISNQLALVLIEQKEESQQKRAVQIAEMNAQRYNRAVEALATLGWVYFRIGKVDDAERIMSNAINAPQVNADTAYYTAKILLAQNKTKEALTLLEKAIDSKGAFVNRSVAETLLKELKAKK